MENVATILNFIAITLCSIHLGLVLACAIKNYNSITIEFVKAIIAVILIILNTILFFIQDSLGKNIVIFAILVVLYSIQYALSYITIISMHKSKNKDNIEKRDFPSGLHHC